MQIGMVGLGRMGGNMSRRLVKGGHEVVAFILAGIRARATKRRKGVAEPYFDAKFCVMAKLRRLRKVCPTGHGPHAVIRDPGFEDSGVNFLLPCFARNAAPSTGPGSRTAPTATWIWLTGICQLRNTVGSEEMNSLTNYPCCSGKAPIRTSIWP